MAEQSSSLRIVATAEIQLRERQRKKINVKAVRGLAKSITEQGLLHPIVCIEQEGVVYLVAGERRLRALELVGAAETMYECNGQWIKGTHAACTFISDRDEINLRQVELEENVKRIDITWQERIQALDALHTLRTALNPRHTLENTSKEIGAAEVHGRKEVARATILAPHLDNPLVASARDAKEALGIATRIMEAEFKKVQERHAKATKSKHILIVDDFAHAKPPGTFDCVIADPPYGLNAASFGNAAKLSHIYNDAPSSARVLNETIIWFAYGWTKKNAHLYLFCDIELFISLRDYARRTGWFPWRTPLIWHKSGTQGHAPLGEHGFRRVHELILFCVKGEKPFGSIFNDVVAEPIEHSRIVAAQKPVALYKQLLLRSCSPGERVLDPCCGSGTIFPAAEENFMTAVGIEKDEETAKLAQQRLDESNE